MRKLTNLRMYLFGLVVLLTVIFVSDTAKAAIQDIAVNMPIQVTTAQKDYQFTLERQGKVVLELTPSDGNTMIGGYEAITLYEIDEDENEVKIISAWPNNNGAYSLSTTPVRLSPGKYIIKYTGGAGATANLTIQYEEENAGEFESEKNNEWSTANYIELNKEYKGNLQSVDDIDIYKIQLKQAGSFYLNLRNIGTSDCWKTSLYVEDENLNRKLISSWENTTNKNSKFTRYRLPKGTYYIKISKGTGYSSNDYKIGTTYVAESSVDSEIEYNNTVDTANEIETNREYKANISTNDDKDYFSFSLEEASKLLINVKQENDNVTNGLYNLTLYRKTEDGTLMMYDRFNTSGNRVSKGNEVKVPSGIYILCVKNNNGNPEDKNDYIIMVEQTIVEEEITVPDVPKDVEGEAGIPLAVNSTTLISKKEGRYLFSIPKQGEVVLELRPSDGDTSLAENDEITLYEIDEDENEIEMIKASVFGWKVSSLSTETVRLTSGNYIIKYTGNYYGSNSTANLTIHYEETLDLSKAEIMPIDDQIYNGKAIVPELSVTYNGKVLKENKDYIVAYSNNVSAGTASVTLIPVEDVSVGAQTAEFTIQKREIPVPVVKQSEFIYDGSVKQVILSSGDFQYLVAENDTQVKAGNYVASYSLDTNNCKWEDDYSEEVVTIPWSIKKANAVVSVNANYLTYIKTVGEATFTLEGISTNSDGVIQYVVTQGVEVVTVNEAGQVTPLKEGTAVISVSVPETENYNASVVKTVSIQVKTASDNQGNTVSNNTDQIKKVASTKAKIKSAANVKGKKIKLTLSGLSGCNGYQVQYSTKSNFKSSKIKTTTKNSITLTKLKKNQKYYVRVRTYKHIGNSIYFGKWSSKKSVKIKK
ncbi:MAG: fibronectin type III domain-containing protein [Clostridiales bacterium]|nr:fibronectin type III domain-containing protein [Clostridiales bacterium]